MGTPAPLSVFGHLQWVIIQQLRDGRRVNRARLAETTGASPQQISRAIYRLKRRGFPISSTTRGYALASADVSQEAGRA